MRWSPARRPSSDRSLPGRSFTSRPACIFALLVTGIPDAHRGRVLTLVNGLSRACTALALLLGGVLATTVGARAAYVVAGVAGLAVAIGAATALRRVSVRRDLANPALVDLPAAGQAH